MAHSLSKPLLIICLLTIAFCAGCKKGGTTPDPKNLNSWTFNGITHKVSSTSRGPASGNETPFIVFQDDNISTWGDIDIYFKTIPATSGTYKLIKPVGDDLKADEMTLGATDLSGTSGYNGSPIDIEVVVANGKIKITLPELDMKSLDPSKPIMKLKGSISEL